MKYKSLLFVLLAFLIACTGMQVVRHPDYNFPPTDPNSIVGYTDDMKPTYPYIIIGKVVVDTTWTLDFGKAANKLARLAAQAGADGILFTGTDINIYAFNQYVTVSGYTSGDAFYAAIQPHAMYIVEKKVYGYLIKRTG